MAQFRFFSNLTSVTFRCGPKWAMYFCNATTVWTVGEGAPGRAIDNCWRMCKIVVSHNVDFIFGFNSPFEKWSIWIGIAVQLSKLSVNVLKQTQTHLQFTLDLCLGKQFILFSTDIIQIKQNIVFYCDRPHGEDWSDIAQSGNKNKHSSIHGIVFRQPTSWIWGCWYSFQHSLLSVALTPRNFPLFFGGEVAQKWHQGRGDCSKTAR